MKLRKLEYKDIPFMLEWMHDKELTKYLKNDFEKADENSQKSFIDNSNTKSNMNFAIVDEIEDEYLGSISLKNINYDDKTAEYAICLRNKSQGKNIAFLASQEILKIAFYELNLNRVYLNVLSKNIRANKFYEKFGFIYEGEAKEAINIKGNLENLKWYRILKSEFENEVE